jgi:glutamate-1-semialdehyde 2,1-aminomutase
MEPIRNDQPLPGFLESVRELASINGSVMIFDEITAAFRMNSGGAHLNFGIEPDIAVFAKAISNGYPMGVVLGRKDVMQAAQDSFISSTHWTERIGPTAALATIRKHRELNVASHLMNYGTDIQNLWKRAADSCGLKIHVGGIPPLSHFSFEYPNGQAMMTLFVQMMLDHNILASNRFYASFAHNDQHMEKYRLAVYEVFPSIKQALQDDLIEKKLKGDIAHAGFQRLT